MYVHRCAGYWGPAVNGERNGHGGVKRDSRRGEEGKGIGWERNLIYRRLRSVIGLWRVPVRHAVMHEQRPITRNVTIHPGDLCAYPRNYFALGPRVMNTGLNSGPNRPLIHQTARKIDIATIYFVQYSISLIFYNVRSYTTFHYFVQMMYKQ